MRLTKEICLVSVLFLFIPLFHLQAQSQGIIVAQAEAVEKADEAIEEKKQSDKAKKKVIPEKVNKKVDTVVVRGKKFGQWLSRDDSAWSQAMFFFIIFMVFLGSAAFASSIAEKKRRSNVIGFIGGAFVPFLYPIATFFILPKKRMKSVEEQIAERSEDDEHFEEGAPPIERAPKSSNRSSTYVGMPEIVTEDSMGSATAVFTQQYFKGIMQDELGNFRGPFSMGVDGQELRVERIVEAMEEVISIETINSDGKQQKLRLPYKKIESCREL